MTLTPFPIAIDDRTLELMHAEARAAAHVDYEAILGPGASADEVARLVRNETGEGWRPKASGRIPADAQRSLFAAALILAEPYHSTTHHDRAAEVSTWLREAGEALWKAGGIGLMQDAFYGVRSLLGHAIPLSRAWNGIGTWRH